MAEFRPFPYLCDGDPSRKEESHLASSKGKTKVVKFFNFREFAL